MEAHKLLAILSRNFQIAAGLVDLKIVRGATFNDGDFYKWLLRERLPRCWRPPMIPRWMNASMKSFQSLLARRRRMVTLITWIQLHQRAGDGERRASFKKPENFEMHNFGQLMTAACVHYRATGKNEFFGALRGEQRIFFVTNLKSRRLPWQII